MTKTNQTDDSEEVYDAQFITIDESQPITVRYNALAYERKLSKQTFDEAPITQRISSNG